MRLIRASRPALKARASRGGERRGPRGEPAPRAGGGRVTSQAGLPAREPDDEAVRGESARPEPATDQPLPERHRKSIFQALVAAQDGGATVAGSRALVARLCRVSETLVRGVEEEGLEKGWPLRC